ncbi:MAG: thioredoxin family protein [Bacteroidetes bacterium]|nr:thioredoxin family protein [Bacteroidota bacterium]
MKKINWPIVLLSVLVLLLLIAYVNKNNLNEFISNTLQKQASPEVILSAEEMVQKNYNYQKNKQDFEFTFLEFSSTGCAVCKQMEPVLEEIKVLKKVKVNVVFLHIMKSENQDLMKYYGISAVPMQILLDKNGKEFFRHYGFISSADLKTKLIQQK